MSGIKAKLDESIAQLTAPGAPWEIQQQSVDNIDYATFNAAPANLKELFDAGRAHGDNEFIIYEEERISFKDFFRQADQLSHQLIESYGISKGDRVAIAMRNYPEWMTAFVAITTIGAVVVPLNSWGQAKELAYGLSDSGSKLVFCDQQRFDYISPQLSELNLQAIVARPAKGSPVLEVKFDPTVTAQAIALTNLISGLGEVELPEVTIDTEDLALIMYTSGTTGDPKGAASRHRNTCQSIYNFELIAIASAMTNPEAIGKMLEKGYAPKVLLSVPLFHVSGCHAVFMISLRAGRPIVMMYKWDIVKALQIVERERITMLSAAPSMLYEMLESPEWNNYDTSSIFGFGAGGSAQPSRLPGLVYEKIPDSFPGTGYGMTETNAAGFSMSGGNYADKPLSGGTLSPLFEVKFCDEKGQEVVEGSPGEIYLRSTTVVKEYWNKPEATASSFKDGWFITGDIGYVDDSGYIFLTDRVKDMIIRGGENIYSAEIEATLSKRDDVQEVAAFGIPHESLGEELAVAIYPKSGRAITEQSIIDYVSAELAGFKVPSYVYIHQEPLPKNAAQKVLKKQLRDHYVQRKA